MDPVKYWSRGVDRVPAMTGAATVMDCRDLVDACRGLGVELPLTHVVDVGCGTGRWAQHCIGAYLGLDISPDAVRYAQRAGRLAMQIAGPDDVALAMTVLDRVAWICCFSVFTHIPREERQAYLKAFPPRIDADLLVDVIPGDGSGTIQLWTARWPEFLDDLVDAGWEPRPRPGADPEAPRELAVGYERVSPDGVPHRYVWATRRAA